MHQQLKKKNNKGGDPTKEPRLQRHREGVERLLMSLVWLMRGERAMERVMLSLSLSLIWSLVGLKQLRRSRDKVQRGRKTCFHVLRTHSKLIKAKNEQRGEKGGLNLESIQCRVCEPASEISQE